MENQIIYALFKVTSTPGKKVHCQLDSIFSNEEAAVNVAQRLNRQRSKEGVKRGSTFKVKQLIIYNSLESYEASLSIKGQ